MASKETSVDELPFEEFSKAYSDREIANRLHERNLQFLVIQALSKPLIIFIVIGSAVMILFNFSDLLEIAIILITASLLLLVRWQLFKRLLANALKEYRKQSLVKVRLMSFAEKIGWEFRNSWKEPHLKGAPEVMTSRLWLQRTIVDDLSDPSVIISNTILNIATRRDDLLFSSVVAIRLPAKVRQLYLESLQNVDWRFNNLSGDEYAELQQLSLEGDFQKYFRLYCLPGNENEALYVFTPELMALMIDTGQLFSAEIAGSWLFLFRGESFTYEEAEMRSVHKIVSRISAEFRDNTKNLAIS